MHSSWNRNNVIVVLLDFVGFGINLAEALVEYCFSNGFVNIAVFIDTILHYSLYL